MARRFTNVLLAAAAITGCGGAAPTSPAPTGPMVETFSGMAQIDAAGGCSGSGHAFSTGEGEVSVTLVQTSGNVPVAVQICHPTALNHALECTIPPFAQLVVGASLRATVRGGRSQVLTIFPSGCGQPGNPKAATVSYMGLLEHPQ